MPELRIRRDIRLFGLNLSGSTVVSIELRPYAMPNPALSPMTESGRRRTWCRARSKTTCGGSLPCRASGLWPSAEGPWAKTNHPQSSRVAEDSMRKLPLFLELEAHPQHSRIRPRQNRVSVTRDARKSAMHTVPCETRVHECRAEMRGLSR